MKEEIANIEKTRDIKKLKLKVPEEEKKEDYVDKEEGKNQLGSVIGFG